MPTSNPPSTHGAETPPTKESSRLVRFWIASIIGALLLLGLYTFHPQLLHRAANAWIIHQHTPKADAIVVLGGGLQTRPFAAAELYRQNIAPKILLMHVEPSPTTELGLTPTEQDLTRQILLQQGVPASDLITIGHNVSSSYEEALAVQQWLSTNQNQHLLIPTDPFHTRRVNSLYHKLLRDTPTQLSIQSVPQPQYSPSNWWQTEEGLIAFQNEVVKYAFYRLKY